MPEASREIDAAVQLLYDAFASQPRRAHLDFCDHCVSPQEADALVRTPIRDISADLLQVFVLNAMSETWGSWEDLQCYLPRILELVASGDLGRYDVSGLFSGMGIRWREWPEAQQHALTAYLTALWRLILAEHSRPGSFDVPDVLEAAQVMGITVTA